MDFLPRSTTRPWYQAQRQHKRNNELCREERGLPLHPANGFIDCPTCDGRGEHTRNDSDIGDPQCEYASTCGTCFGTGEVQDGLIDPLLLVAKFRAGRFTWAMDEARKADRRHYYRLYLARAMKRCTGLSVADERAAAQRRENEIDRAWAVGIRSWSAQRHRIRHEEAGAGSRRKRAKQGHCPRQRRCRMTASDRAAHRYAISRVAFAFFFICVGVLLATIFQGLTS